MAGFIAQDHDEVMSEINMVPFIDVMLVLLVIFIITVPVMKHAVNVQLPRAANEKEVIQPQTLRLTVQADGSYWLDEQKLADDQLGARLQAAAARQPQRIKECVGRSDVVLVGIRGLGHVAHDVMLRQVTAAINVVAKQDDFLRVQCLDVSQHGRDGGAVSLGTVGVGNDDANNVPCAALANGGGRDDLGLLGLFQSLNLGDGVV